MAGSRNIKDIGRKIATEGPHKIELARRRVRAIFNGKYAFDTVEARHVWEHPYYPQFYVPSSSFTSEVKLSKTSAIDGTQETAHIARLTVGDKSTDDVIIFNTSKLHDLVKVDFPAMDQWLEEDVRIYQHPKDPYKRIDILQSTRSVKVALNGVTLAETTSPLFLLETSLPTRYYLPPTSVDWSKLTKSDTETYCPYKGKANYYRVTVNGKEHKDLVWYYVYPTLESAPIVGHLCFYNEKVDIWVDGEKEKH